MNGKIFTIQRQGICTRFIDVCANPTDENGGVLWDTDEPVVEKLTTRGTTVKASNNRLYELLDVSKLIPTYISPINITDVIMVSETVVQDKPIHYGDGVLEVAYEFNRELSLDEFKAYMMATNHNVNEDPSFYRDYAKFEGSGCNWNYKLIRQYTD